MQVIGSRITMRGSLSNSTTTKMETMQEIAQETQTERKRSLQWVKGDKIGIVEVVKSDDGQWLTFESGGRISKPLVGEYMLDVAEGTLSADELSLNTAASGVQQSRNQTASTKGMPPQKSPVRALLDRSQQHDEVELTVKIQIKTPTALLMSVLRDSFGDEAVIEAEEFVMSQVNPESLVEAAREELKRVIESL
jgi:hypothetical protein